MPSLTIPLAPPESGHQLLSERIRLMTDDEFYEFCQENDGYQSNATQTEPLKWWH